MPRDGSGVAQVYPGSNTNSSGTVIQSSLENSVINDLYAVVNSTPTSLLNGSAATPSLSFFTDPDTGLYRIGANNLGLALGGAVAWNFAASNTSYTWVDAGAAVGPVVELFRDSASPATSDFLGGILFTGRNASAAKTTYAQLASTINTATAGSEIGQLTLKLMNTGTVASYYIFDPSGILPLSNLMGNGSAGFPWGSLDLATGGLIRFGAANVELVHSSGVLSLFGATAALFDISDSTAGQIKFPASQHASANANTLDDYAEGTWTPVLTFATPGNLSVVYAANAQLGTYTKIGRLVIATCDIDTTTFTFTTASGVLQVTGLPITSRTLGGYHAVAAVEYSGITKAGYNSISAEVGSNTTIVNFNASGTGVTVSAVSASDTPTAGNVRLRFTITYEAA